MWGYKVDWTGLKQCPIARFYVHFIKKLCLLKAEICSQGDSAFEEKRIPDYRLIYVLGSNYLTDVPETPFNPTGTFIPSESFQ